MRRVHRNSATGIPLSLLSADRNGGTDDLSRAAIGFTAVCPDGTGPGSFLSCAGPVEDASDLVDCVDRVTRFNGICRDAATSPWGGSDPAEGGIEPAFWEIEKGNLLACGHASRSITERRDAMSRPMGTIGGQSMFPKRQ